MKVLLYTWKKKQEIASEKMIRAPQKSFIFQPLICYVICRKIMEGYVFVPYKLENTDKKQLQNSLSFNP